jgi:hypothetical protein
LGNLGCQRSVAWSASSAASGTAGLDALSAIVLGRPERDNERSRVGVVGDLEHRRVAPCPTSMMPVPVPARWISWAPMPVWKEGGRGMRG